MTSHLNRIRKELKDSGKSEAMSQESLSSLFDDIQKLKIEINEEKMKLMKELNDQYQPLLTELENAYALQLKLGAS